MRLHLKTFTLKTKKVGIMKAGAGQVRNMMISCINFVFIVIFEPTVFVIRCIILCLLTAMHFQGFDLSSISQETLVTQTSRIQRCEPGGPVCLPMISMR